MSNGEHRPPIDDLWHKNAIIYCLDVEKYVDSNGDGIGDFGGLTRRLDYLAGLGITWVWLQPLSPSPNRDNGYDVSDIRGAPKARHAWRIRRIYEPRATDRLAGDRRSRDQPHVEPSSLVSIRAQRSSVDLPQLVCLSKTRPDDWNKGVVFSGVQKATWTRDPVAGEYYFHRF